MTSDASKHAEPHFDRKGECMCACGDCTTPYRCICRDCGGGHSHQHRSLPDVLAAVTLGPEDRLVLVVDSPINPDEHRRIQQAVDGVGLTGRVLVGSRMDALVLRATKAEGSTVGQCGDRFFHPMLGNIAPCWVACHLAYGHTGMHSDGETTWTNEGSQKP